MSIFAYHKIVGGASLEQVINENYILPSKDKKEAAKKNGIQCFIEDFQDILLMLVLQKKSAFPIEFGRIRKISMTKIQWQIVCFKALQTLCPTKIEEFNYESLFVNATEKELKFVTKKLIELNDQDRQSLITLTSRISKVCYLSPLKSFLFLNAIKDEKNKSLLLAWASPLLYSSRFSFNIPSLARKLAAMDKTKCCDVITNTLMLLDHYHFKGDATSLISSLAVLKTHKERIRLIQDSRLLLRNIVEAKDCAAILRMLAPFDRGKRTWVVKSVIDMLITFNFEQEESIPLVTSFVIATKCEERYKQIRDTVYKIYYATTLKPTELLALFKLVDFSEAVDFFQDITPVLSKIASFKDAKKLVRAFLCNRGVGLDSLSRKKVADEVALLIEQKGLIHGHQFHFVKIEDSAERAIVYEEMAGLLNDPWYRKIRKKMTDNQVEQLIELIKKEEDKALCFDYIDEIFHFSINKIANFLHVIRAISEKNTDPKTIIYLAKHLYKHRFFQDNDKFFHLLISLASIPEDWRESTVKKLGIVLERYPKKYLSNEWIMQVSQIVQQKQDRLFDIAPGLLFRSFSLWNEADLSKQLVVLYLVDGEDIIVELERLIKDLSVKCSVIPFIKTCLSIEDSKERLAFAKSIFKLAMFTLEEDLSFLFNENLLQKLVSIRRNRLEQVVERSIQVLQVYPLKSDTNELFFFCQYVDEEELKTLLSRGHSFLKEVVSGKEITKILWSLVYLPTTEGGSQGLSQRFSEYFSSQGSTVSMSHHLLNELRQQDTNKVERALYYIENYMKDLIAILSEPVMLEILMLTVQKGFEIDPIHCLKYLNRTSTVNHYNHVKEFLYGPFIDYYGKEMGDQLWKAAFELDPEKEDSDVDSEQALEKLIILFTDFEPNRQTILKSEISSEDLAVQQQAWLEQTLANPQFNKKICHEPECLLS